MSDMTASMPSDPARPMIKYFISYSIGGQRPGFGSSVVTSTPIVGEVDVRQIERWIADVASVDPFSVSLINFIELGPAS